ncbi:MAG: hypothetical protein PSY14_13005 [bacterium]|nr:hypothetical protein [bacterium]
MLMVPRGDRKSWAAARAKDMSCPAASICSGLSGPSVTVLFARSGLGSSFYQFAELHEFFVFAGGSELPGCSCEFRGLSDIPVTAKPSTNIRDRRTEAPFIDLRLKKSFKGSGTEIVGDALPII